MLSLSRRSSFALLGVFTALSACGGSAAQYNATPVIETEVTAGSSAPLPSSGGPTSAPSASPPAPSAEPARPLPLPVEGIVEALPDGTRQLRAPGLQLRARDGLAWVRVVRRVRATCAEAGREQFWGALVVHFEGNRTEVRHLPSYTEVAPGVCANWLSDAELRGLLARTPAPNEFRIGDARIPPARLSELLGGTAPPGPPAGVMSRNNGVFAFVETTSGPVKLHLALRAGAGEFHALRVELSGPSDRVFPGPPIELVAGRGRVRLPMSYSEGGGTETFLFFGGTAADANALASAPSLDVRLDSNRILRVAPNPFAPLVATTRWLEASIAARPVSFGLLSEPELSAFQ